MPYSVRVSVNDDVLEARIEGKRHSWASRDAIVAWKTITDRARNERLRKVLVDIHLDGTLSVPNALNIGTNLGLNEWDESCRLAFLIHEDDQITRQEFAQSIAVSKGFMVKIFRDRAEASRWLVET